MIEVFIELMCWTYIAVPAIIMAWATSKIVKIF